MAPVPPDPSTSLSPAQRRLLEQRLRQRATGVGEPANAGGAITRVTRNEPLPLSYGQERLWLLHHLEPGNAAYNSAYLYRWRGPLVLPALARSLQTIVARHESLRTTIGVEAGNAYQVIQAPAEFALTVTDVVDETQARAFAAEAAVRPFDLTHDVLLRAHVYRLGPAEHLLLLVAHHSAWDATSTHIFWRELTALYAKDGDGAAAALPPLPVHYADFAVWQRRRLEGERLERLLQFWRPQLADLPTLELPWDRPRPAELTYRGDVLEFSWPADVRDGLHALAQRAGVSLFMVLLAGWTTLLRRLAGTENVITGTAVAGRARRELEGLIGFFVNTLALPVHFAGDPSFAELLQQIRHTTLAAFDHDELPFEKLVAELRVPRDPSRHPIFQNMLVLHPGDGGATPSPADAVEVTRLPPPAPSARFDLAVTFTEQAAGLRGLLEYRTDLCDAATVQRWVRQLETLLRAAIAAPETKTSRLPLLQDDERAQLVGSWSGAAATYPRDATVPGLFTEHARRTPTAIALVEGAREVSYAELERRANHLAHRLLAVGVHPGDFVAIDLDRSVAFVVSVLAVLKCGAAYVPLLADLPPTRRKLILDDTRAAAIICNGAPWGEVPAGMPVLDAARDETESAGRGEDGTNAPEAGVRATDAAYVMYTSGSTGRPKGVVLPHRGIVRLVCGETPSRFGAGDRFLLLASTAFDASTFELWAPLLNGGSLAIFPERWPEFEPLARAVRTHGITHLFLTAGLFNQVVDHRPDLLTGVTHVFTGGEAMSPRHAARVQELWPALRVTNCYGPTEITTYTISHELAGPAIAPATPVPIGRPVPNARAYVLDTHGDPVPIGVAGELFLGGDGLALGYLHRPELTAERFVPDPFALSTEGARMYRTGDRARWRADGLLEFLGRVDAQVKIRGYRIEPGEIEAVLAQLPGVRHAAVVLREDTPGQPRLVAYVVPHAADVFDAPALRGELSSRLPEYMVPAAIVPLAQLPLTANGKLDRRALPAPEQSPVRSEARPERPPTPTEEGVARVWQATLGPKTWGLHENFFACGGHSLLAMQASAQLGAMLGRDVPLRAWFDHPTIAGLAAHLDRVRGTEALARIEPVPRDGELPLSHEEQRLWFLHHALPDPATYHVVWGWRVRGALDVERLRAALATLLQRHEILRTGYANHDGRAVRVIQEDVPVPLTVEEPVRSAGAMGDLVLQRRLAAEGRHPFAPERPPLWRVLVLRLSPDDHLLAFTAHHLICDEWSLPILHDELAALYAGTGHETELPSLTIQYADYAAWQQQRVADATALQPAREFWREHLRGAPDAMRLPVERPRPATPTGAGRRLYFELERGKADALETLGREAGKTAFVAWFAAAAATLARWSGQADFVVGTPLAQRARAEVQRLPGFFLNTLPLRVRAQAGRTPRAWLREMREVVLGAFAHGELPLDAIAATQARVRIGGAAALFNVMFVLHDDPRPRLGLAGLAEEPLEIGTGTAKADLTLFIDRQTGGTPRGEIEYNSDVLTPEAVEWVVWELRRTIDACVAHPDVALFEAGELEAPEPVPETNPAFAATRSGTAPAEFEQELLATWRQVLRRDDVGRHDNFFDLGGHSLLAMELVHELQRKLGRVVPLARLLGAPTVAELAGGLAGETAGAVSAPQSGVWRGIGQGTPYFHIPGMNGVEFLPTAVAERLNPDRRWFDGLQHPGADGRDPPAESLEPIAADLVRQIRAVQPHGPYSLGGFCHGGLVAYEVAHQLEREGEIVAALVLWDTFPAACWRSRPAGEVIRLLRRRLTGRNSEQFVADRWRFWRHRMGLRLAFLGRLIRARLPGRRGRIEARMTNAGLRARRRYHPRAVRAPVLLVRSRDERVLVEKRPQEGWGNAMLGRREVIDLPCWHFDLLEEPAVSDLAEKTAAFLRRMDEL